MTSITERAEEFVKTHGLQLEPELVEQLLQEQREIDAEVASKWVKENGEDFCYGANDFDGSFAASMIRGFILSDK